MNPFDQILDLLKGAGEQIYKPALLRMTEGELLAVLTLSTSNRSEEALDAVRQRMTAEELAEEKRRLRIELETRLTDEQRLRITAPDLGAAMIRILVGAAFAAI